jgi:glycine/D-amino acid oxidase-like deaminating enzyme
MDANEDAVIGAGVHGASVAFHLADRGVRMSRRPRRRVFHRAFERDPARTRTPRSSPWSRTIRAPAP